MKRKALLFTTVFTSVVLLILRVIQQLIMIDPETGFWFGGYDAAGNTLTGLMLAAVLLMILLSRTTASGREVRLPERSRALAVFAALLGLVMFIDGLSALIDGGFMSVIYTFSAVCGAAALCWWALSLLGICRFKPQAMLACSLFGVVSLAADIVDFVGQVTICQSLFDILSSCALTLFLVSAAKYAYCYSGDKTVGRSLMCWSSLAAVMCGLPLMTRILTTVLGGTYSHAFTFNEATKLFAAMCAFAVVAVMKTATIKKPD